MSFDLVAAAGFEPTTFGLWEINIEILNFYQLTHCVSIWLNIAIHLFLIFVSLRTVSSLIGVRIGVGIEIIYVQRQFNISPALTLKQANIWWRYAPTATINDKDYTLLSKQTNRKLYKIGTSFDSEKWILNDWRFEEE